MKLFIALLFSVLPALAAQSFTGAWKLDASTRKFSGTPVRHEISNGMFKCLSCNPPETVKADGKDQAFDGPGFDTMSVRIIDDHAIEIVRKREGKVIQQSKRSVSPDGKTITVELSNGSGGTQINTLMRIGEIEPGAHLASGSWMMEEVKVESSGDPVVTFEETADGLNSYRLKAGRIGDD